MYPTKEENYNNALERTYGTHNVRGVCPFEEDQILQDLWHRLAPQYEDDTMQVLTEPNNGLTQKKNEIIEVWRVFRRLRPKVILELGIAQGGSFAGWCELAPEDAFFIAMDQAIEDCRPRPGDPIHPKIGRMQEIIDGTLTTKLSGSGGGVHHLKKYPTQTIEVIRGWSFEKMAQDRVLKVLDGRKIDFMFHDASHEASMFQRDYDFFWPLMAEGGVMAVQDIAYSSNPDVTKPQVWEQIKRNGDHHTCYEYAMADHMNQSMGIGLLFK
jgi:cephalosporin hydroxylase